jgi:hypothetical protein
MTTARERFIPLEAKGEWEDALRGIPHAFAHTWGSCRAMHLTTDWPTFLYTWEKGSSRAVCAIAERSSGDYVDVVTPYGFGGIVGEQVGPDMLADWQKSARNRNYVCAYLGLNPELMPTACRESPDYSEDNEVFILELDRGEAALHDALSRNRRRQLLAFRDGPARLVEERDRLAAFFRHEVEDFLRRKGATSTYRFTRATWDALLTLDNVILIGAEGLEGGIAAVCVFAFTPYCAEALFGISCPSGNTYSAPLIWAGAMRLIQHGVPRLNLGGGVQRGDGIAMFKERFGAKRLPFGALKEVYRPDIYATLSQGVGKDPSDRSGYFPAYRSPVRI